jgi:hypothetical protein
MIHINHLLPNTEEVNSLKQYCLTQGDTPWNQSSFFDQVTDKCYQQVIDSKLKNVLNTYINADFFKQGIPKLEYFD